MALFRSLHFQETRYESLPIDFIATKEIFKSGFSGERQLEGRDDGADRRG